MTQPAPSLIAQLQAFEQSLLDPKVRRNHEAVSLLLADNFVEFGSSGRICDKAATLTMLTEEVPSSLILSDFCCDLLAHNVALVTYRAHRTLETGDRISSLRSSIWTLEQDSWRMRFHQGTRQ